MLKATTPAVVETLDSIPALRIYQPRLLKALWPKPAERLSKVRLPTKRLRVENIRFDANHLRQFKKICGFSKEHQGVPLCYPHLITFGLHTHLLTEPDFPFNILGAVHIENTIERTSYTPLDQVYSLEVYLDNLMPHSKGASFDLVSELSISGSSTKEEVVWRETSTNLVRLPGKLRDIQNQTEGRKDARPKSPCSEQADVWKLTSDLGRIYGAVSGDRNPIHLYPLTAKAFGFKRQIIHGMWTLSKSSACAEMILEREGWDTERLALSNRFYRPVFLPAKVHHYSHVEVDQASFQVWNPTASNLHMQAEIKKI